MEQQAPWPSSGSNRRATGLASYGTASLHVSLLDRFELQDGDTRIALPGSAERVLAFLAIQDKAVRRALVAGILWPHASNSHAYGNLRSALSRLGSSGHRAVRADPVELELVPSTSVDLRAARALAMSLLGTARPAATELSPAGVLVLSTELLPGWYDDWVLTEAEAWRQLRLHALETLAGHLSEAGRFGEAIVAAGEAVRTEPLRESAHAALIRVHLAEGNHAEALRQFDRLRDLLRAEFGLEPSARLRDLLSHDPGDALHRGNRDARYE